MLSRSAILGIYQDAGSASSALALVRRHGFIRSTTIAKGRSAPFAARLHLGVDRKIRNRYRPWVLGIETFLLIETDSGHVKTVLDLLASGQQDRPITFAFHPESLASATDDWVALRNDPPSLERLIDHSRSLAEHQTSVRSRGDVRAFSARLDECESVFESVLRNLSTNAQSELGADLSSEWLLDNAHLIRSHFEQYRSSLTPGFYEKLPILDGGPQSGLPRAYAIARSLVACTDAQFDKTKIVAFLGAYQSVQPLTLCELWAMPLMLRLALFEHLKRLILHVDQRQRERQEADFCANRLLVVARDHPELLMTYVAQLTQEAPSPSTNLVEQILGHLHDETAVIVAVRVWVEKALNRPMADILNHEQHAQALQQVSLTNAIGSLRDLSRTDWRTVVEDTSLVDLVLLNDPADVYEQLDFETRDRYRHVVERIARRTTHSELEVTWAALEEAQNGKTPLDRHVGYHLVDQGLYPLERKLGCRPTIGEHCRRSIHAHPGRFYLVTTFVLTLLTISVLLKHAIAPHVGFWAVLLIALPAILIASEVAVSFINWLAVTLLIPRPLPRLDFSHGIPDRHKTLIVVPMMLLTPESIRLEVERLEIHWLANQDNNLLFALLADYSDAPQQRMPEDLERLDVARREIDALAARHGDDRFFLLHREREWSNSENCWMGWERKRGKIEDLNRLLMNEPPEGRPPVIVHGHADCFKGIQYVITLDADTQLPHGTANRLVGAMAHPLNRPQLSEDSRRVVRGYTIIQPRVSTSLPSATSTLFTRLFTDQRGADPYSHVSADLYQDLAGQATYYGKGIYDLYAFHRVLTGRFPDAHLLSHDLLESDFVRAGFASDVELFDFFPSNYVEYSSRQHRWLRGDWQIVDWLFPRTPVRGGGKELNTLCGLARWKIFDNLRRSLIPPAACLALLLGWMLSGHPLAWTLIIIVAFGFLDLFNLTWGLIRARTFAPEAKSKVTEALARILCIAALMPHQAYLSIDAIARVVHRRYFSHQKLLEWETAQEAHKRSKNRQLQFILAQLWTPVFCLIVAALCVHVSRMALIAAAPFLLLWAASPAVVAVLCGSAWTRKPAPLSESDRLFLRRVARRTWRFFDDFVSKETNWLPPDNYQASLRIETAPRTSLTNIALWLLSAHSARDFGYETVDSLVMRLEHTFDSLDCLERPGGHLLNWYQTLDLSPCRPRYVSSVDSGNLLGALWAFVPGAASFGSDSLLSGRIFDGFADTAAVLREFETGLSTRLGDSHYNTIEALCKEPGDRLDTCVNRIREMRASAERLAGVAEQIYSDKPAILYWSRKLKEQVAQANLDVDRYLRWAEILDEVPAGGLVSLGSSAHVWRRTALASVPSLMALSQSSVPGLSGLVGLALHFDPASTPPLLASWLNRLSSAVEESRSNAAAQMERIDCLAERARQLAESIDMRFMFDEVKQVFSIGFNVDEQRLDNSFYDLLASESRLGSLVAIASGDVPAKHWGVLGRPFAISYGYPALLSWSGTMFEYLMPLLLMKCFKNSLLDLACQSAVAGQIEYARMRGVPWGISESGYSALDSRQIYQYYAFGVPGLGLKRDMDALLVVAPYASVLALAVNPDAAVANLRRLSRGGTLRARDEQKMLGDWGYYEAIDYSRRSNPAGQRGVIVRSYMAHHQGMSLVALDNALNGDIMRNRFHADPRIKAVESLLYEGVNLTGSTAMLLTSAQPVHTERVKVALPSVTSVTTPNTVAPRIALLSNSSYSVMVTNAGGGYSSWKDIEITRWRADATRDSYGTFCYLKDTETGVFWSTTHHPVKRDASDFSILFALEKAEIKCRCQGIESITDIVVSPEDDVELRRITLVNHSGRNRNLELTTYAELALAEHNSDRAHPAFSKLFVETAYLPASGALSAHRRPRSNTEHNPWAFHLLTTQIRSGSNIQYETRRAGFIGRGRDLSAPRAMDGPLAGATGAVLDPIFSIRRKVTLKPGDRIQFAAVLGVAQDEEALARLAMKYSDRDAAKRAIELSWTAAQLALRHLRIPSRDALEYQRLAAYLVYPGNALRPSIERLRQSKGGQERLWAHGISGDLPIVVITIGDESDLDVVKELLLAHSYWRIKSLKCDLVILCDEAGGYYQPLAGRLRQLVEVNSQTVGYEKPGGVYIRPLRDMGSDDAAVLQAAARIVLVAARGSIGQQMGNIAATRAMMKPFALTYTAEESPSVPIPFLDLDYFNGRGGFTKDRCEYAIYQGVGESTPAPWINVMANPEFGAIVSEAGAGMTWAHNSQSNRLTSWSNDPVMDPPSDAIYLRDKDLGAVWSPTSSPIRERDPYRARHGCGYTIFEHSSHAIMQELTVYVPVEEAGAPPVRVQILKLRNDSNRPRRLTLTAYAEWVLGTDREETQSHVLTSFDRQSQAIFARNSYRRDFPNNVAFLAVNRMAASYTCDRAEFLGRNGSMSRPDGMMRDTLSKTTGEGLDPCAAIRVDIVIEPGREETLVVLLGEARNIEEARNLIARYSDRDTAVKALQTTRAWWDRTLSAVSIETPQRSADLLVNRWLLYQTLCCRIWGRSAFYQSGGAYGFRDQLQDAMALLYARPEIARAQILRSAARQFREGDVQHWWHVETGAGPRTRISDDLLWLVFVTAQYVRVTGDHAILDEPVTWLNAPLLAANEQEIFSTPAITSDAASLLEHCRRAIAHGATSGPHGLPLIGGGDWNDGLNRVGAGGRGESVWLAWFLIHVRHDMAELLRLRGGDDEAGKHDDEAKVLADVIERVAWDGQWYTRAYFDDGSAMGSAKSDEAKIDSIPQSWAVISGAADPKRAAAAMAASDAQLVREDWRMLLLFTPPFDKTSHDPGYIKGYVPGVRENGGQYTHAALWTPLAWARLGDGEKAVKLLQFMNPIEHSQGAEGAVRYVVEPYVVAADVYSLAGREGRGGWTWYTGSAAWMYRVWVEEVLGLHLRGDNLTIAPVIPPSWPEFTMRLRHGDALYVVRVVNPSGPGHGVASITLDGKPVAGPALPLSRAAGEHEVLVTLCSD